jgi:spermidine/putrescine transport system substrate-binding protein
MTQRDPSPLDPGRNPLTAAIIRSQLSRRTVIRGAGATGAAAFLAACSSPAPPKSLGSTNGPLAKDVSDVERIVNWANWPEYLDIDEKTKKYPTLEAFAKQTGIKVSYTDEVDDNSTYYNKVAPQLKANQDIKKDIFTLTDWMASKVIRQGFTQKLDKTNIPNAKNLLAKLQEVTFDPGREHSLTWQSGYAGIGYDRKAVGKELKSLDDLWAPELKGKIVVLSEMRDTIGLIMLSKGKDPSSNFPTSDFDEALAELEKQIGSGQIRRVKGNSYVDDLKSGNALAAIAWSGDVTASKAEKPSLEFVLPESGGTLWSDNMMIPSTATHKKNAEAVMNYYYDPKVAATVAAYVNYICPVEGAQAEMEKIDKTLATSPLIFPTEADLAKVKVFRPLTPEEDKDFSARFEKAIGN